MRSGALHEGQPTEEHAVYLSLRAATDDYQPASVLLRRADEGDAVNDATEALTDTIGFALLVVTSPIWLPLWLVRKLAWKIGEVL